MAVTLWFAVWRRRKSRRAVSLKDCTPKLNRSDWRNTCGRDVKRASKSEMNRCVMSSGLHSIVNSERVEKSKCVSSA